MGNRMKGCNLHHPETQGGARCCSVALHHCTTTTPLKGGWSGVAGGVLLRGGANPAGQIARGSAFYRREIRQFSGVLCAKVCRPEKQTLENLRPWQFPAGIIFATS
jgi:hypothetical protein